ncbi:MAG TPA: anhydro-N-acetylmuramic acid kinase, partial [Flavobacteriaceae bacterium]|nr:anhydro-N-acetylmuramic acid kinase [Flavobacteriaceae bacterium]
MYLFTVNKQRILGLMSGTSLDGLDLCLADFMQREAGWTYTLVAAQTLEYTAQMRRELSEALTYLP